MSSILDHLKSPGPTGPQSMPGRKAYPDGWQPRLEVDDTDGGFLYSKPSAVPQEHAQILADFGLNPQDWIVDRVRKSRWQRWDETWLESSRLSLLPVRAGNAAKVDMADLEETIKRWHPSDNYTKMPQHASFVAPTGDTQIGGVDKLGGSLESVERILTEYSKGLSRFQKLNKEYNFEQVVLPQLGDCIENVNTAGGAHILRTDLGVTEMVRVYRRLLWAQIKLYSAIAPKILVPIVPGNHDEALRIAGKMATTSTDSWAIDAGSALYDAVQENSDLKDRVAFVFPEYDELTVAVDVSGTVLGMCHGHQMGKNWELWWDRQAGLRSPIGGADVLLVGHLHHLNVRDHTGGRTFIQVPALDNGSQWFKHTKGAVSPPRAVTFWTSKGLIQDFTPIGASS